jgi:hypothetical protein
LIIEDMNQNAFPKTLSPEAPWSRAASIDSRQTRLAG